MFYPKFEFTNETIESHGIILHRIKSLKKVRDNVPKGTIGGFLPFADEIKLSALSHEGTCWIAENSMIFSNSVEIKDSALVGGKAQIFDNVSISDLATISENTIIRGNSKIRGSAKIKGKAKIS